MDWDEPVTKKKRLEPANLEILGIQELNDYIAELQAEIERARGAIASKQGVRAGAEALFKR